MVIINTKADDVSIQALSPLSTFGGAAGAAAGAPGAGAGVVGAVTVGAVGCAGSCAETDKPSSKINISPAIICPARIKCFELTTKPPRFVAIIIVERNSRLITWGQ